MQPCFFPLPWVSHLVSGQVMPRQSPAPAQDHFCRLLAALAWDFCGATYLTKISPGLSWVGRRTCVVCCKNACDVCYSTFHFPHWNGYGFATSMNVEHFGDLCLQFENDTPIRLIRCVCGVQLWFMLGKWNGETKSWFSFGAQSSWTW